MRYIEDLSKPQFLSTREELDEGRRRQARIATFASEDVRELLKLKHDVSVRVTSWNVQHVGQGLETHLEDEYRRLDE
jgi:predicted sugar kinase